MPVIARRWRSSKPAKQRLARQPREDMLGPNAVPVAAVDLERAGRCQTQSQCEAAVRQAILNGRKVFDQ